ncbi:MAG: ROK family protein [Patescibacteria group bacterium]|nr:ROK family protein [Patescibacteria group bacterium]
MYVGIDIGGTKTLVAVLTNDGKIVESIKFPTPAKYSNFLLELAHTVHHLEHQDFVAGGVAAPGRIDRKHGRVVELGNLGWTNFPLQADCEKILRCPVVIENDANLAGLSEALLHRDQAKVLYVTISTGIGTGFVYQQQLDPGMLDSEGGHIMLPFKGQLTKWETFGSGRAIYNHFGKKAADIHDEADWKHIVRNLSLGFFELIAVYQPDLIIIGGSIGTYFDRWGHLLQAELDKRAVPVIAIPKITQAQRPEEAVVYGCYDLAKQVYGKHA